MATTPRALCVLSSIEKNDFLPPDLWKKLEELLPGLIYLETPLQPFDWKQFLKDNPCDILIGGWSTPTLPEDLLEWHPLKYVCYLPGSLRKLIPRVLIEKGLRATNWGASISRTIAECALMLTLAAHRRLAHWSVEMHVNKGWKNDESSSQSLFERKIGLHGFGAIAQTLVPLLKPFSSNISVYAPLASPQTIQSFGLKSAASLEALFQDNEVIIELSPLTPENHGIITEKILRLIPKGGVFVNVARGAIVNEAALARVAQDGHIQIGLDVYTEEPLSAQSPLRGLPNVALLPHMAGPTRDRRQDSGRLALENIQSFLQGNPLQAEINLTIYDQST